MDGHTCEYYYLMYSVLQLYLNHGDIGTTQYRRKWVSADDNMNCFCRILMICNVCIVLAKTLNDIWIRMLYHMNYAHNGQAYELHIFRD